MKFDQMFMWLVFFPVFVTCFYPKFEEWKLVPGPHGFDKMVICDLFTIFDCPSTRIQKKKDHDFNRTRKHNHLVCKQTLNYLANVAQNSL